jgi:hypothetical protein
MTECQLASKRENETARVQMTSQLEDEDRNGLGDYNSVTTTELSMTSDAINIYEK